MTSLFSRLQKLNKEATPRPWRYHAGFPPWIRRNGVTGSVYADDGEQPVVHKPNFTDAELIVECRNSLPAVLNLIEAARQVYEEARAVMWDDDGIPNDFNDELCGRVLRMGEAVAVFVSGQEEPK